MKKGISQLIQRNFRTIDEKVLEKKRSQTVAVQHTIESEGFRDFILPSIETKKEQLVREVTSKMSKPRLFWLYVLSIMIPLAKIWAIDWLLDTLKMNEAFGDAATQELVNRKGGAATPMFGSK
jgi:hypothetical protein